MTKYHIKLRDVLQDNWPIFFKRVIVMKVNVKQRNDTGMNEIERQINIVPNPGLWILLNINSIIGTSGKFEWGTQH